MMKHILILLMILCSQQAAAQSYGAGELLISPSVTANGMAETGVAFVDEKSMYFNPAALGLFAKENKISVTGFPKRSDYIADITFYNSSLSVPLQKYTPGSKFLFAIGAYYSSVKLGIYAETTPEYPDGTGRVFEPKLKNYNFVFSAAYISKFHISIGAAVKKIEEDIFEWKQTGISYDAGLLIQLPCMKPGKTVYTYFKPAFGAAIRNMGEFDLDYGAFGRTANQVAEIRTVDLPRVTSIGLNLEIGVIDTLHPAHEIFRFRPTLTLIKFLEHDYYNRIGFEAQIYKAFAFRIGYINNDQFENTTTIGFSIDSGNLLLLLNPSLAKRNQGAGYFFSKVLSFKYSYSDNSDDFSDHDLMISVGL